MVSLQLVAEAPAGVKLLKSIKYGDQMVCVRYRYDAERKLRHKTVELSVETAPWEPLADAVVGLKVGLQEIELQSKVRQVGGKWNRGRQVLELSYDKVLALGLASRLDHSTLPNNGKVKILGSNSEATLMLFVIACGSAVGCAGGAVGRDVERGGLGGLCETPGLRAAASARVCEPLHAAGGDQ